MLRSKTHQVMMSLKKKRIEVGGVLTGPCVRSHEGGVGRRETWMRSIHDLLLKDRQGYGLLRQCHRLLHQGRWFQHQGRWLLHQRRWLLHQGWCCLMLPLL